MGKETQAFLKELAAFGEQTVPFLSANTIYRDVTYDMACAMIHGTWEHVRTLIQRIRGTASARVARSAL